MSFTNIIRLKKVDVIYQITGFIAMIYCWQDERLDWSIFSMYLMAAFQIISCGIWMIVLFNKPVIKRRFYLQRLFIIVTLLLLLLLGLSLDGFGTFSLVVMTWLGPVLGISYFITTIREISFYKSLLYRDAI